VRDKFTLLAWGLDLRECMRKRRYFLEATEEIKRRFRKLLYLYLDKKAEINFMALTNLIENYDKDEDGSTSVLKTLGKLSKKSRKIKKSPVLQTVEEEDLEETTLHELDDSRLNKSSEDDENEE